MQEKQATRIALWSCLRKRPLSEEDARQQAESLDLYFYCCPFSKFRHHWHLTNGTQSRPWGKILRATQVLGCLGPCEDELPS